MKTNTNERRNGFAATTIGFTLTILILILGNEIINNYGENSEFVNNFYSISFIPFKKEMEKIMIF